MMAGDDGKAVAHYIEMIRQDPQEGEYWVRLARIYEFKNQLPFALKNINEGIRLVPEYRQLYIDGFRDAALMKDAEAAKDFLRQWLDRHPDDREIQNLFASADKLLEDEFGLKPSGPGTGEKGAK